MRAYMLLLTITAVITYLLTPFARWVAAKVGAYTAVRVRDVHRVPTARLGGLAMFLGLLGAYLFASHTPFLDRLFGSSVTPWAILIGAGGITLLGIADDIWDLDWFTKLSGQVLIAGFVAWYGVQFLTFPIGGITVGSTRLLLVTTVIVIVATMNAVNFVDGLDGLAAGVMAIGGGAFFIYTYVLSRQESSSDYSNLASFIIIVMIGICIGFLPHNFHPSKIFMGDSGALLIGYLMACSSIIVTGQIDPSVISRTQAMPAYLPIVLPLSVLLLPLVDMTLAVIRRLRAGQSPFHPDAKHIHHKLLRLGHSHRRTVLIMYMWTALGAYGVVSFFFYPPRQASAVLASAIAVAIILTLIPLLRARKTAEQPESDAATSAQLTDETSTERTHPRV